MTRLPWSCLSFLSPLPSDAASEAVPTMGDGRGAWHENCPPSCWAVTGQVDPPSLQVGITLSSVTFWFVVSALQITVVDLRKLLQDHELEASGEEGLQGGWG